MPVMSEDVPPPDLAPVALGPLNGHSVGRILKEAVRRAGAVIRAERQTFEAQVKKGYGGDMNDVFTSADTAAQEVYLRTFRECFPGAGVIGEENSLSLPPTAPCTAYFTVDPLDGTKAFVRRQSHGIATMVAMVDGGEVISAYIGDISSDEVYGYRPGSNRVHRITRLDSFETLAHDEKKPKTIEGLHGLLRDPAPRYGPEAQALIARFENHEVMGSSIGTWAARLWKGEVGALVMPPGHETPWDSTPVIGITRKLGYVHLRPEGGGWAQYEPELPRAVYKRGHDTLIVHSSLVENGRLKA
jgi:fructose-1,6-bisphosphatase/inositol monophosphatase family enzyme